MSVRNSSEEDPQETKPVLEKLQQFLKEKNPPERSDSSGAEASIDLRDVTGCRPEDRTPPGPLEEVLNYKKAVLLRDPEVVQALLSIAQSRK